MAHLTRISDFRLSHAMRDLLEGIVLGKRSVLQSSYPIVTAAALQKRGLLDKGFSLTPQGREVVAALIARKPQQYAQSQVKRMVDGLRILQRYEPDPTIIASLKSRRCIELQEEAFSGISEDDVMRLEDLGWERIAPLYWVF